MDDTSKRGPADRSRINVHERWELDYWTKALGVTKEQLEQAVAKVGPMVEDVKRALGK